MWQIGTVVNMVGAQLWFSDGLLMNHSHGGYGSSSRLIIDGQGFLDITEIQVGSALDFNGHICSIAPDYDADNIAQDKLRVSDSNINIDLTFPGDETFTVSCRTYHHDTRTSGTLKPLPIVSKTDAEFLDEMMEQKYLPYPHGPQVPGKTKEEREKLGQQFFPFSPYSFQLATVIYDWTTASFVRMVLNKVFEYTGIPPQPFPLDEKSIALMIWESDWDTSNPRDPDYMNSFLMKPASSLADVEWQLASVRDRLHEFSIIENRLLAAALQAMPRTSLVAKPRLFSGQVDMYQFGVDRFGIELLECPLNAGPVGQELIMSFDAVLSSYLSEGKIITTKTVWSFTDSVQNAMHFQNGIMLIANPPEDGSWTWETVTYITPLSDNPEKIEYTFFAGTSFLVQSVDKMVVMGEEIVVINLQPITLTVRRGEETSRQKFKFTPLTVDEFVMIAETYSPELEKQVEIISTEGNPQYRIPHSTGGRRCRCVDAAERLINEARSKLNQVALS